MQKDLTRMGSEISKWLKGLKPINIKEIVPDEEEARYVYIFSADMIKGFCKEGNLASERVDAISQPIANLFIRFYEASVKKFILLQEWHDPHAKEFESFPEHGVQGTEEAETIPELSELPFADEFVVFRKNTFSPAWSHREKRHKPPEKTHPIYPDGHNSVFNENFDKYLEYHDIHTAIVVGNCTDLCTRELAMYIRMWANEHQKDMRIIIPENCVETFDLSFDVAVEIGATPHPGDVYHAWALYEMARNNIEIVKEIV